MRGDLFEEGSNCWQVRDTSRLAFLVDADAYFHALAAVMAKAQHVVMIISWDFDSRVRWLRNQEVEGLPETVGEAFYELVKRRKELNIYVLNWDYLMVYAADRELIPAFRRPGMKHRRIHFRSDGNHPVGASHHEKIVVVDDRIAFVGGMDLAGARWDTPEHKPDEPLRVDPAGDRYDPVHDLQVMVEGEAARALGDITRERWRIATGRRLDPAETAETSLWPDFVEADLRDVPLAIARTRPPYARRSGVQEIESLYLDAVALAERSIYIENQYLTARKVIAALTGRLREADGPEVIIVLPRRCSDWLEESTMGILRAQALKELRAADAHGRLALLYPTVPGLGDRRLNVHSKVMVVDEEAVLLGSANLNNRSMRVDTECIIAFEAGGKARVRSGIARLRGRLLSEHLGIKGAEVEPAPGDSGSLGALIASRAEQDRTLRPLPVEEPGWKNGLLPAYAAVDPEEPIDPEFLLEGAVSEGMLSRSQWRLWIVVAVCLCLAGLAAAWRWTPLSEWLSPDNLQRLAGAVRELAYAPWVVMGAFLLGGMLMFPVTALVFITAFVFDAGSAFVYALLGCVLSAVLGYTVGHFLGHDLVARLTGSRMDRLSRRLADHGIFAVFTVRIVPVAPFTVISMLAGASHIKLWHFVAGTLLGMFPGVAAISIFARQLEKALFSPGPWHIVTLALILLVMVGGAMLVRKWLKVGNTE